MPLLSEHMRVAGGYYNAVDLAKKSGCGCVQLITKPNNQWRAKEITPQEANRGRAYGSHRSAPRGRLELQKPDFQPP